MKKTHMSNLQLEKSEVTGENESIELFRRYLQIPSVHPDVDYSPCVKFLTSHAQDLGLSLNVIEITPRKPIVVISWPGLMPNLPSLLLNSHMDVVPVFPEFWKHDPFGAVYDRKTGLIYGRGTQDMKSVGIQYLEAIRQLKTKGIRLQRTVNVSFVPDEEIGGDDGAMKWCQHRSFDDLNVGFVLDEGLASETDKFLVYYGERTVWKAKVICHGTPGHGSLLLEDTAGEKLRKVLNKFFDYRDTQVEKLKSDSSLSVGDVTTVNLTMIDGGKQSNVVPPFMTATFDIRISLDDSTEEFEKMISGFCKDSGSSIEFEQKNPRVESTSLDDTNRWWKTFQKSCFNMRMGLETRVFPGGTDGRFFRLRGLPVLGFSPMNHTPVLLHDHNEYLDAKIFLRGIEIYERLITDLANMVD